MLNRMETLNDINYIFDKIRYPLISVELIFMKGGGGTNKKGKIHFELNDW